MKNKTFSKILVSTFLSCMVSTAPRAQHYDDSFFHAFQEKAQQDFKFLDSIGAAADQKYGPFLQATKSRKEIQRMRRLRRDFYPNGDIRAAMRADSIYMETVSSTANRNSGCINAKWKPVGPIGDPQSTNPTQHRNGRLDCVAFKSTDPNILYVGSGDGGGLWKVNGTTGAAVSLNTDHLTLHNGVGTVATAGNRIVISTGNSYIGKTDWDMWQKACRGIYYSDDEGVSWQKATVTNKNNQDPFQYGTGNLNWVSKIEVHPTNPDIIFMTVYNIGVIEYGNDEKNFGALFKSTNKGATWTEVNNSSLANRYFQDIEFHPVNPNIIYLSSQRLYKSTNGGSSWSDVTSLLTGLPARPAPVYIPSTNSYDQWNWQWYRLHLTVPNKGCNTADGNHVMVLASPVNVSRPLLYHSTNALTSAVNDIYPPLDPITYQDHAGWAGNFP